MLRRALLLSLLFHLILLAGSHPFIRSFDFPGNQRALAMTVVRLDVQRSHTGGPRLTADSGSFAVRSGVSPLSAQAMAQSPQRILPSFLPSTAANRAVKTELPDSVVLPTAESSHPGKMETTPSAGDVTISADGIRRYRLILAREARQYQRYPAEAREQGWQGEVVLSVQSGLSGQMPRVTLARTSGYELLDAEALTMMLRAVKQAVLPDNLSGKQFSISLPVHYRLDDLP